MLLPPFCSRSLTVLILVITRISQVWNGTDMFYDKVKFDSWLLIVDVPNAGVFLSPAAGAKIDK